MLRFSRKSREHSASRLARWSSMIALLGGVSLGAGGCLLPALSAIPSVISIAHDIATSKNDTNNEADTTNHDPEVSAVDSTTSSSPKKPGSLCQLIAISRPDLVVVELRKSAGGAPEYRELHLVKSADDAYWAPMAGGNSGAEGWQPAVNFLAMDFKPPLTEAIPDSGTCYLAYRPTSSQSTDPNQPAEFKTAAGDIGGSFSWEGRVYQYVVARTLPCLPPAS